MSGLPARTLGHSGLAVSIVGLGCNNFGRRGQAGPAGARLSERNRIATDAQFALLEALERYARDRERSLVEVAIGGLLARPVVSSVIAGATKPEQVRANAAAARWTPSEHDIATLSALIAASPS